MTCRHRFRIHFPDRLAQARERDGIGLHQMGLMDIDIRQEHLAERLAKMRAHIDVDDRCPVEERRYVVEKVAEFPAACGCPGTG